MKKKFATIPSKTVTLYRGDDSIDFELRALPIGYTEHLNTVFRQPTHWVDGVETEKDDPEYWPLFMYLLLARSLKQSGILESIEPQSNDPARWRAYAQAVRQEFIDANINVGEVAYLRDQLTELNKIQASPDQRRAVGNGSAPTRAH